MIRISALILIAIGTASAADVAGKWNVTATSPGGATGPAVAALASAASGIAGKWKAYAKAESGREYNVELNLATDGDRVTGTLIAPEGDVSITDGKLDGDQFSFRLLLDEGAYAVKLTLAGDNMSGMYTGPGGEKGKVTARR